MMSDSDRAEARCLAVCEMIEFRRATGKNDQEMHVLELRHDVLRVEQSYHSAIEFGRRGAFTSARSPSSDPTPAERQSAPVPPRGSEDA